MKPTIRRARTSTGQLAAGWITTWPGYGLSGATTSTAPSWRAALAKLSAPASAGPLVDRHATGYTAGHHAWHRPRRIEV